MRIKLKKKTCTQKSFLTNNDEISKCQVQVIGNVWDNVGYASYCKEGR